MKYPLPAFHFQVDWNGDTMEFAEVSGLVMEQQSIEWYCQLILENQCFSSKFELIPNHESISYAQIINTNLYQCT